MAQGGDRPGGFMHDPVESMAQARSNPNNRGGLISKGRVLTAAAVVVAGGFIAKGTIFDSHPAHRPHNIALSPTTTAPATTLELPSSTTSQAPETTTSAAPTTSTVEVPRTVVSVKTVVVTDPNTAKQLKEAQDQLAAQDQAKKKADQDQLNAENARKQAEADKLAKRKQQCADLAKVALPEPPKDDHQDFVWDLSNTGDGVDPSTKEEGADGYRYDPNPPNTSEYYQHKNPKYDTYDTNCYDVGGHKFIVVDWLADNQRNPYMPPATTTTTVGK